MTRIIRRTGAEESAFDVSSAVRDFMLAKRQAVMISRRESELKRSLSELVERSGYIGDKRHLWFDLPEPVTAIDAKGEPVKIARLKRERRVSRALDSERAEKILRDKGLWERCVRLVPVLDEEEIMRAHYADPTSLTEQDIDEMHPTTIIYAFRTVE